MITRQALEAQAGFKTTPVGSRYPDLFTIRGGKLTPRNDGRPDAVPATDGPSRELEGPVLPADIIERLRHVEVARITGHRPVRTALMHLDVRLGGDLGSMTQRTLLDRLGGDRACLRSFQEQASAYVRRDEVNQEREARERRALEDAASAAASHEEAQRTRRSAMASSDAGFWTTSLKANVVRSLGMLNPRDAAIVARKLGVNGMPEPAQAIADGHGIHPATVLQTMDRSIAELDRADGWPTRLKRLVKEVFPASERELRALPCFEGLGAEQVAAHAWFGARERVHVIEMSTGPVVGHLPASDWKRACARARSLVRLSALDTPLDRFVAALHDCLPAGRQDYGRFLLLEIGLPSDPGKDWLFRLKGSLSASDLIREVTNHPGAPSKARAIVRAVEGYIPEVSAKYLADIVHTERRNRSKRGDGPDLGATDLERIREACERHMGDRSDDAQGLRASGLAKAIADDPDLEGMQVDAAAVHAAIRTSSSISVSGQGWLRLKPDAHEPESPAMGP